MYFVVIAFTLAALARGLVSTEVHTKLAVGVWMQALQPSPETQNQSYIFYIFPLYFSGLVNLLLCFPVFREPH